MTHIEQIQETLHRVENGQQTDEDISFLRQLLLIGDRQIVSQLSKYNVNIGEGRDIHIVVFSPDGKNLFSGSNDETIVEWKITENEFQVFPERHRRGVTSIAISPDGKMLISGGRDQTIKIWQR
jgi:WD40 repeat protein